MKPMNSVECPKCGNTFDVSEILTHRIKENIQKDFNQQFAEVKKVKAEIAKQQELINDEIDKGINLKLKVERIVLEKSIRAILETEKSEQIKSYEDQLNSQVEKTKELLRLKAEHEKILRENSTLKDQYSAELQIKLTKAINDERIKLQSEIEKATGFKIAEKDILIDQLKTEIKNAQRRIDQSSQQLQGEAAEITIENYLREAFPTDEVTEYKKGERGADSILTVKTNIGDVAGKIIYEIKRTKTWQKNWIDKFREDLGKKNANFGILVSEVYPNGITHMTQIKGVWVCSFTEYQNLSVVLRHAILLLFEMKNSHKNKGFKMELLHEFLTGPDFKNSVESIINSFTNLKRDLDKEKGVIQGYWKSREIQLERVLTNTVEMYHSIRSILGDKAPTILSLEGEGELKKLS